jgi:hypothetical protein
MSLQFPVENARAVPANRSDQGSSRLDPVGSQTDAGSGWSERGDAAPDSSDRGLANELAVMRLQLLGRQAEQMMALRKEASMRSDPNDSGLQ